MPFISPGSRKGGRLLAAVVGAVACLAMPATATAGVLDAADKDRKTALNTLDCTVDHELSTPFTPWGDLNLYAKAPQGDFEPALVRGWLSGNGASIVQGNQPWHIGSTSDAHSLRLGSTQSAWSAPMCIDATYPFFRFFARNLGDKGSDLKVTVAYVDRTGRLVEAQAGALKSASTDWFVSPPMQIDVAFGLEEGAAAPVEFRFTSAKGGDWRVDDVYVDPWARR